MISVNQLNRAYGALQAVKDVTFSIEPGEVIGLLGPNGAGKTTIMKMLCGYIEPSAGTLSVHGIDVAAEPKTAQAIIGYLPESLPVYPEMTVAAYLKYAAGLRGVEAQNIPSEVKRVIDATELNVKALDKISSLSRGLKQRVGVAQALLGNPKVLVLDEPTNGLDPTQTQHMRALIRRLAEHATVILSTHILSEVEAVCDRVLMVNNGNLVLDEKLESIQKGSTLEVKTNLPEETVLAALLKWKDLNIEVTALNGVTSISMPVEPLQSQAFTAEVARAITVEKGDLYHLAVQHRNLESLFKEVNTQKEEAANAA